MSFDRVAGIYDATRGLPVGVADRVADRVVAATHAGPRTQILEMGIGTGRIALPFIERGYPYTGVDISTKMIEQLRAKIVGEPLNLTLIEAGVSDIPLPDAVFDVVMTVHVLHLVPSWTNALSEARRLLRPHGYFVDGHDSNVVGTVFRDKWANLVEQAGATLRPDYGSWRAVEAELTTMGCRTANYRVAHWEGEFVPMEALEEQRNRVFSKSWDVPDDILEDVYVKMLEWTRSEYGDPQRPVSDKWEFTLSVSRFPE